MTIEIFSSFALCLFFFNAKTVVFKTTHRGKRNETTRAKQIDDDDDEEGEEENEDNDEDNGNGGNGNDDDDDDNVNVSNGDNERDIFDDDDDNGGGFSDEDDDYVSNYRKEQLSGNFFTLVYIMNCTFF